MGINGTQLRSIVHAWDTIIAHIFHINGEMVSMVAQYVVHKIASVICGMQIKFICNLEHVENTTLNFLYYALAKYEMMNICKLHRCDPPGKFWKLFR